MANKNSWEKKFTEKEIKKKRRGSSKHDKEIMASVVMLLITVGLLGWLGKQIWDAHTFGSMFAAQSEDVLIEGADSSGGDEESVEYETVKTFGLEPDQTEIPESEQTAAPESEQASDTDE